MAASTAVDDEQIKVDGSGGRRVTVLLSGGVDSAVVAALLIDLGRPTETLFVDYGQPAAAAEARASTALARHFGLPHTSTAVAGLHAVLQGEIPGRNDVLIALARAVRPTADVAIGIHAGTGYSDCSPQYIAAWQAVIDVQTGGRTRLIAPLRDLYKPDVLDLANDVGVPMSLTHSCERSSSTCGSCTSCLDRRVISYGSSAGHGGAR